MTTMIQSEDPTLHVGLIEATVWADAVAALTREMKAGRPVAGFEQAIDQCGRVLAEHFPPRARNPNELPDHLVLL